MPAILSQLLSKLKRLWRSNPEPQDPYAYSHVRVPVGRGPRGRAASVALEEPEEGSLVGAFGRQLN